MTTTLAIRKLSRGGWGLYGPAKYDHREREIIINLAEGEIYSAMLTMGEEIDDISVEADGLTISTPDIDNDEGETATFTITESGGNARATLTITLTSGAGFSLVLREQRVDYALPDYGR